MMLRRSIGLCAVCVLAAVASARAGEIDKYLPEDTEMVVSINVRQILDSDLYKKNVGDAGRDALKSLGGEVQDALDDLGFDPFKDLDRVIVAGPAGGEQDRGLVIAHGRFNLDKFRAKAEKTAKDDPNMLKIHKIGDGDGKFLVYEVQVNDQAPNVFVALADDATLLASPGKDYVVDAMRKVNAKEPPTLKNMQMQELLGRMNTKQSISVAMLGAALTEGAPQEVKDLFGKIDVVGGGVTIGDDIKIELAGTAKSEDDAKQVVESLENYLNQARLLAAALAFSKNNKVGALVELINSVKITAKEKTVVVKAGLSADAIDSLMKQDK
ncbi:MAG TPA: hypothetical protein VMS17_18935 [Gemmataceae bacterium]|nr:hypothetical protein [Gemmataceae bacterium]